MIPVASQPLSRGLPLDVPQFWVGLLQRDGITRAFRRRATMPTGLQKFFLILGLQQIAGIASYRSGYAEMIVVVSRGKMLSSCTWVDGDHFMLGGGRRLAGWKRPDRRYLWQAWQVQLGQLKVWRRTPVTSLECQGGLAW